MADVPRGNRPLSPHLQVYRLPLTAITSIMTRGTGQGILPGLLLVVWWLVAAGTSDAAFATADWFLRSWLGWLILLGSTWSLWFHFLAGLRHLWYDSGRGLEIDQGRTLSIVIIVGSVVLALLTVILMLV
ncbi:succinate dehydrogenase, cytochrome b556 subunit [Paracoccus sp. S-4012]|uniref:succinate dehydrogenase, cytochrome b556 subunit n=1 Tax=Paracoccus sp. S-4012 TaxID=2665648 RepID=UPI0012B07228|nr:succinate dehydrogenase, cytochrome b556 subunit [Paracoccus sp. S-4012]MRX50716.1 succinate dehydrogenase, cytochrome b556 subunit [Paracoccus sp. S-4012]